MSRYRPPQPKKSPYITRDGYERLLKESQDTWKRRRLVTKALAIAAAEGDRSENAEYIYRKKELREIDRRVRHLETRIPVQPTLDNTKQLLHDHRPERSGIQIDYELQRWLPRVRMINTDIQRCQRGLGATVILQVRDGRTDVLFVNRRNASSAHRKCVRQYSTHSAG